MSGRTCFCGCHADEPRLATHVDPDTGNPICRECLTWALNEDYECICSRDPDYRPGAPGWSYYDAQSPSLATSPQG